MTLKFFKIIFVLCVLSANDQLNAHILFCDANQGKVAVQNSVDALARSIMSLTTNSDVAIGDAAPAFDQLYSDLHGVLNGGISKESSNLGLVDQLRNSVRDQSNGKMELVVDHNFLSVLNMGYDSTGIYHFVRIQLKSGADVYNVVLSPDFTYQPSLSFRKDPNPRNWDEYFELWRDEPWFIAETGRNNHFPGLQRKAEKEKSENSSASSSN